jgi:hypothetical protein
MIKKRQTRTSCYLIFSYLGPAFVLCDKAGLHPSSGKALRMIFVPDQRRPDDAIKLGMPADKS